jgi:hypothetical protein
VGGGEVRVAARLDRHGRLRAVEATPAAGTHILFAQAARAAVAAAGVAPGRRLGFAAGGRLPVTVRWVLLRPAGTRPARLRALALDSLPTACPRAPAGVIVVCARGDWPLYQVVYE